MCKKVPSNLTIYTDRFGYYCYSFGPKDQPRAVYTRFGRNSPANPLRKRAAPWTGGGKKERIRINKYEPERLLRRSHRGRCCCCCCRRRHCRSSRCRPSRPSRRSAAALSECSGSGYRVPTTMRLVVKINCCKVPKYSGERLFKLEFRGKWRAGGWA